MFVFVKGRDFFIDGEGQLYGKAGAAATGVLNAAVATGLEQLMPGREEELIQS